LQANITDSGITVFLGLSAWGNGVPYFLVFAWAYLQEGRPRAFYYAMFLTVTLFVMNITKMAYHEPRPFMFSALITPYGCSSEYGNPSGHSIFAASFNFFLYLDVFHSGEREKKGALWRMI